MYESKHVLNQNQLEDIVYEDTNFIQTKDKTLTFKKNKLQVKTNRKAFKILQSNKKFYMVDTFGDCFFIETSEDKIEANWTFGILCQPKHFSIENETFILKDEYNRTFEFNRSGFIENILF